MVEPEMTVELACEIVDAWGEPQFGLHVIARTLRQALAAEVERRRAAEAERDRWHKDRDEWCLKAMSYADDSAALSAAYEHAEEAEALAERMWPIVEAVSANWNRFVDDPTENDDHGRVMVLEFGICRAAAALVREREEKETGP